MRGRGRRAEPALPPQEAYHWPTIPQPSEAWQVLFRLANRHPGGVVSRSGSGKEGALSRRGCRGDSGGALRVGKRSRQLRDKSAGDCWGPAAEEAKERAGRGGFKSGVRVAHGRGGAGRVPGETVRPAGPPRGGLGPRLRKWVRCPASVASRPALSAQGCCLRSDTSRLEAGGGRRGSRGQGRPTPLEKASGLLDRFGAEEMGAAPQPLPFRRSFPFPQTASASTSCPLRPPARGCSLPQPGGCRCGQGKS